ncbi:MAG: AAA family ATPase, partial [Candidatus Levybacteria bacterium]|nr:AAA family ATPase [Candidatus Levybacteria bacterium]
EQNEVEVPEVVKRYVDNSERGGASPRGYQTIILAAKAHALLEGRFNVSAEDIKSVALPSLRHRITLNFMGEEETTTDEVIKQILEEVPVP